MRKVGPKKTEHEKKKKNGADIEKNDEQKRQE